MRQTTLSGFFPPCGFDAANIQGFFYKKKFFYNLIKHFTEMVYFTLNHSNFLTSKFL